MSILVPDGAGPSMVGSRETPQLPRETCSGPHSLRSISGKMVGRAARHNSANASAPVTM